MVAATKRERKRQGERQKPHVISMTLATIENAALCHFYTPSQNVRAGSSLFAHCSARRRMPLVFSISHCRRSRRWNNSPILWEYLYLPVDEYGRATTVGWRDGQKSRERAGKRGKENLHTSRCSTIPGLMTGTFGHHAREVLNISPPRNITTFISSGRL